jgi:predicted phage terminase large subunit-like protein
MTGRNVNPILTTLTVVRFWDLAATKPSKQNRDPDWTAGALVGVNYATGLWYILDVRRTRETPLAVEQFMLHTHEVDDEWLGRPVPIRVEMEGGASGKFSASQMQRGTFLGLDFTTKKPVGDKRARAKPLAVAAEAGHVIMVEGLWNDDWLDELDTFPDGPHDDQVDACSGGFQYLVPRHVAGAHPDVLVDDEWAELGSF